MQYYLIVQRVKHFTYKNKIELPTDEKTIKNVVDSLVGNILVYLYDENNRSKDVTSQFGKFDNNIEMDNLTHTWLAKYTPIKSIPENQDKHFEVHLKNLITHKEHSDEIPKVINYNGTVCKLRSRHNVQSLSYLFKDSVEENNRKIDSGKLYEQFIGQQYEEQGYKIIFHGIDLKKNDGGIDLIAIKKDKMILIQCKNWKVANYLQITSKDIRAFFGDCFKYILDNNLFNNTLSFHYIVADENSLDIGAKLYLDSNSKIKYKCIPFLLDDHF